MLYEDRRTDQCHSINRSRLDSSQVDDRRGRGVGTRGWPSGRRTGPGDLGGGVTAGREPGRPESVTGSAPGASSGSASQTDSLAACQTGADANTREDCRIVGFVNSIQVFWTDEFARQGGQYLPARTVLFTGATQAACVTRPLRRAVLLSGRPAGLFGPRLLRRLHTRFGAQGGAVRRGVRAGSRVRSSRCRILPVRWTSRAARTPPGRRARQFRLNSRQTPGRRLGQPRHRPPATLTQVTDAEIARAWMPRRPWATTGIQRQTQGYVSPSHGLMDRPRSG